MISVITSNPVGRRTQLWKNKQKRPAVFFVSFQLLSSDYISPYRQRSPHIPSPYEKFFFDYIVASLLEEKKFSPSDPKWSASLGASRWNIELNLEVWKDRTTLQQHNVFGVWKYLKWIF